jgi:hypothetical protein
MATNYGKSHKKDRLFPGKSGSVHAANGRRDRARTGSLFPELDPVSAQDKLFL